MRPKVVLAILLTAVVVVAVVVVVSKNSRSPSPVPPTQPVVVTPPAAPAPKPVVAVAPAPATPTNATTNAVALQGDAHEAYVEKRSDELMELAMQNSPAAHQKIVDELKNPDKEIRQAALDALEQANDRSVIPQMQQIADQTTDPNDKQAIEDAIDFIKLPSLTEYLQQRKAQKAAQGNQTPSQPQPQQNGQ
jgi:HEAT repeats